MKDNNLSKGFTLIELLVVVLIIGILAAIALPTYMKAVEKSRAAEAIELLKNLKDAEEMYLMANGGYTKDLEALDITMPNISGTGNNTKSYGTNFTFKVERDWPDFLSLSAERNKSEGEKYYLFYINKADEGEALWCSSASVYTAPPDQDLGADPVNAICKTIANGNKRGIIYSTLTQN